MMLFPSLQCCGLRDGPRILVCLSLLALAPRMLAVMPEVNRLVPKGVPAFSQAGGPDKMAMGAGVVAVGLPQLANPKSGLQTGGVLLWDAVTGKALPTLFPPPQAGTEAMLFGAAVAMSGSTLVIGAPELGSAPGETDMTGGAFLYDVKRRRYLTAQPLRAVWAAGGDRYGSKVAVDGDLVALGAPGASGQGGNAGVATGAVLAVDFRTGDYSRITPDAVGLPGATAGNTLDCFGDGLALQGRTLVVGAPQRTESGQAQAGRVYVISVNLAPAAGPGGTSSGLAELTEPVLQAGSQYGRKLALGSRFLITGSPNRNSGGGEVRIYDRRGLPALPFVKAYTGSVPADQYGLAVATEGNRTFFTYAGRYVFGESPSSPFIRTQIFFTLDTTGQGYGQALAAGDERLAVGQPLFDGSGEDSGVVVLHPTPTLHLPDFYPGPLTGDTAPSMPGDVRVTKLQEVVVTLRPAAGAYPFFVGSLSAGAPGVKGPLGVFEHSLNQGHYLALGQSTAELPLLSRPIANEGAAAWFRAGPKGKGLLNLMAAFGANPAGAVLHGGDGMLFGVNLPVASVGELRVDNAEGANGVLPVRLRQGGTVDAGNDSGLLALKASTPGTNAWTVREGNDLGGGLLAGEVPPWASYTSNATSFVHALTGTGVTPENNQRLLFGALNLRKGDAAPGVLNAAGQTGAAVFQQFTGVTHGATGRVLLRATLATGPGIPAAVNEGLWCNRSGTLTMILQKGQQAPLLAAGVKIKRILNYGLVANHDVGVKDDVVLLAQVAGPGVKAGNDGVLYLSRAGVPEPGQFEMLAREGDRLQCLGGAKIGTILRLEMTMGPFLLQRSYYGLLCSLVNETGRVTAKNNLIWAVGATNLGSLTQGAARLPLPKVRKGEYCEVFGPGYDRVTSVTFPALTRDANGALNTGMAQVIDWRHGGSTGVVSFPNKRQSAALIW